MNLLQYAKKPVTAAVAGVALAIGGARLANADEPKYTFDALRDSVNAGRISDAMRGSANRYVLNLAPDFIETFGPPGMQGISTDRNLRERLGLPMPDSTGILKMFGYTPLMYWLSVDKVPVGHDTIRAEYFANDLCDGCDKWNFLRVRGRYPTGESFDIKDSMEGWRKKVDPNAPGSKQAFDALTAYLRMRDALTQEPKRREKKAQ